MTDYTVRVELHDATWDDYTKLHKIMASQGFNTTVRDDASGIISKMPTAEYNIGSLLSITQIRDKAEFAAKSVIKRFGVLVTQSAGRCWIGLDKM